jgi:hypothetical protein
MKHQPHRLPHLPSVGYDLISRLSAGFLFLVIFLQQSLAADFADPHLAQFKQIKSVSCTAEVFGQRGEKYNPEHKPRRKYADIKYALKADHIYFDYVGHDEKGDVNWSQLYTFDGVRSSDFYRKDKNLNMYDGKNPCVPMDGYNVLLEPYAFLYGDRYTPGFMLTLNELADVKEWQNFEKISKSLPDESIKGIPCRVIEAEGGKSRDSAKGPFRVRVWLVKTNPYYPIKWQRVLADGSVDQTYEVLELAYMDESKQIPYAKAAVHKSFDKAGELLGEDTIVVKDVVLNGPIDDRFFWIDPTLASRIWDAPTNKFIDVDKSKK